MRRKDPRLSPTLLAAAEALEAIGDHTPPTEFLLHALDGKAALPDLAPDGPPSLPWVSTYAGKGCGYASTDGLRLKVAIAYPSDIEVAAATDDIYFVETPLVRVIRGDQIVTLAGPINGSREDGPALETHFWDLRALAVTTDGTVFVAENNRVRKIQGEAVTTLISPR